MDQTPEPPINTQLAIAMKLQITQHSTQEWYGHPIAGSWVSKQVFFWLTADGYLHSGPFTGAHHALVWLQDKYGSADTARAHGITP